MIIYQIAFQNEIQILIKVELYTTIQNQLNLITFKIHKEARALFKIKKVKPYHLQFLLQNLLAGLILNNSIVSIV